MVHPRCCEMAGCTANAVVFIKVITMKTKTEPARLLFLASCGNHAIKYREWWNALNPKPHLWHQMRIEGIHCDKTIRTRRES